MNFSQQDFCNEKFHKFVKLFSNPKPEEKQETKFYFLVFLLTKNIDYSLKENIQEKNCLYLRNYLLDRLIKILDIFHADDNTFVKSKNIYMDFCIYTIECLDIFMKENIITCVTDLEWKTKYTGILHCENSDGLFFKYMKF